MQCVEFVLDQVQREIHLLILELRMDRDLLMSGQSCEQILNLDAAIDQQAARTVTYVELGIAVHALDEIQLSLGEKRIRLHGRRLGLTGY